MSGEVSPKSLTVALSLTIALTGCASGVVPLLQSTPSVLRGTPSFVVLPIDFSQLRVGSLDADEWLAGKSEDQRQSFQHDLEAVNAEFAGHLGEHLGPALVATPGPGVFLLRPLMVHWEPGAYFGRAAETRLVLSVLDDRGREVERVEFSASQGVDWAHAASGDRMRSCARALGDRAAGYLDERSLR